MPAEPEESRRRPANGERSSRPMTVGQLSRRSGVSIKSLREYTDLGLIYTLGRGPSNYRLYTCAALRCVDVIGQLRGLGLTIAEIVELTRDDPDGDRCEGRSVGPRLARLLRHSRRRLEQRIAADRRTLALIDEFEAAHHVELARYDGVRWLGDPGSTTTLA